MTKQSQINELKLALAIAHEHIDGLNIEARRVRITAEGKAAREAKNAEAARSRAETEKKAAAEAETLKHIRNGYVPVADIRKIVVNHRKEGLPGTFGSEFVDIEVNGRRNPVEQAILDALTAPAPVKIRWTLDPSAALPAPFPRFKVGDRVNVQTLPNNGGFLVNGPIV